MAWETPQVVTFSRKKAFFYGLSFPLFTLLPYLLIYTPDTFFPLLTAFILPGIFFAGAGSFYGKNLGKILGEFREEENKKILALAAGGLLGGLIWSFFCLLPEQGGSLAVKTLFLLDLFLFSFSFMIPSFMNNISGKELI